jgi:3-dehydroquinate synthetase
MGAMLHDKKGRGGAIRFALPSRIGAMHQESGGAWTVAAPAGTIQDVLG